VEASRPIRSIADEHARAESALEVVRAVRRAEIAVVGEDAAAHVAPLEELLLRTGGSLVLAVTPATRFVVIAGAAADGDLLAASDGGALLLEPHELATLVDAYLAVWFPDALQQAIRRAREDARRLALERAAAVRTNAAKRRESLVQSRMARTQERSGEAVPDEQLRPGLLSAAEQRIEDSARRIRAEDPRTSIKKLL
jgi:hypothetical protein